MRLPDLHSPSRCSSTVGTVGHSHKVGEQIEAGSSLVVPRTAPTKRAIQMNNERRDKKPGAPYGYRACMHRFKVLVTVDTAAVIRSVNGLISALT